jgi:hypothetical protein
VRTGLAVVQRSDHEPIIAIDVGYGLRDVSKSSHADLKYPRNMFGQHPERAPARLLAPIHQREHYQLSRRGGF